MGVNKVDLLTGETLIDISNDTVTKETLAEGVTAHGADGELITGEMTSGHPIDSGLFGDDITWSVYNNGVFVVKGTGATYDFLNDSPFRLYDDLVTAIIIEDGVTVIGEFAFQGATNVERIEIPQTVTEIKWGAFLAAKIKSIVIPKSVVKISGSAFEMCSNLETIYYGGTKEEWGSIEYADYIPEQYANATLCCKYDSNADTVDGWHFDVKPEDYTPPSDTTNTLTFIFGG